MMSKEHLPSQEQPPLFERIHEELDLQLHYQPNQRTNQICELLNTEPEQFDPESCLQRTRRMLADTIGTHIRQVKSGAIDRSHNDSFTAHGDAPAIESPKRYLKRTGANGSFRPLLRTIHTDQVLQTRQEFARSVRQDVVEVEPNALITDEQLTDTIRTYYRITNDGAFAAVQTIKEIMPAKLILPSSLGGLMMRATGFRRIGHVEQPDKADEQTELLQAFNSLSQSLRQLRTINSHVSERAHDRFAPELVAAISEQLSGRYEDLRIAHIVRAGQAVARQYEAITRRGTIHQGSPKEPSTQAQEAVEKNVVDLVQPRLKERTGKTEILLGQVPSPLAWLPDADLAVYRYHDGAGTVLVCEALPPVLSSISQKVRQKSSYATELDRNWEMIKALEASDNAFRHPRVKPVMNISRSTYQETLVNMYGTNAPNARRTHYARFRADRFDSFASLAEQHGLASDCIVIAKLAETDKAEELSVFGEYGIQRSTAKSARGGSI